MPISYGQVVGRKYTAIQPDYDPEHPKPSMYSPKAASLPKTYSPTDKQVTHGTQHRYGKGCRCDACKAAHEAHLEWRRQRLFSKHLDADGNIQCRWCGEYKEPERFPHLAEEKHYRRYVCAECLEKRRWK